MFDAGLIPSPGWKYPAWSVVDQSQALYLLVIGRALQTSVVSLYPIIDYLPVIYTASQL